MGQPIHILVYSHRGAAGLAPENTLVAFKTGLFYGVDVLDMDVGLTKDKIVVVAHDPILHSKWTNNGAMGWCLSKKIIVKNIDFKDLQKIKITNELLNRRLVNRYKANPSYKQGQIIQSLEYVLKFIEQNKNKPVKYQIELKSGPEVNKEYPDYRELTTAVIRVVQSLDLTNTVELQSFDWRALLLAKKLAPNIKCSFITEHAVNFSKKSLAAPAEQSWTAGYKVQDYDNSIPRLLKHLGADIWCPKFSDLTEMEVKEAQVLGLKVVPWTIDSDTSLRKAISFKVDGIITNRPDKLNKLLNK